MPRNSAIVRRSSEPYDPAQPLINQRHELFAMLITVGKNGVPLNQSDAYREVSPQSRRWTNQSVYEKASKLAAKLRPRIDALKQQIVARSMLTAERKLKILSRIAMEVGEHDPADYVEAGADGAYVTFGKESKNRLAVAGLKSRTEMSGEGDGSGGAVITELKFRPLTDAIEAIKEHNKMTGAYPAEKTPNMVQNIIANGIIIETNVRQGAK